MSSAIVAEGVNKSFGDVQALTHLELDIPEGAFFVLLGPSGAGKTTTLRVIAGLEKPDTGKVYLNGIDATKAPRRPNATWRWSSRATRCTRRRPPPRTSRRP
jgi:multiple sugar transport system ATP-binding protein